MGRFFVGRVHEVFISETKEIEKSDKNFRSLIRMDRDGLTPMPGSVPRNSLAEGVATAVFLGNALHAIQGTRNGQKAQFSHSHQKA